MVSALVFRNCSCKLRNCTLIAWVSWASAPWELALKFGIYREKERHKPLQSTAVRRLVALAPSSSSDKISKYPLGGERSRREELGDVIWGNRTAFWRLLYPLEFYQLWFFLPSWLRFLASWAPIPLENPPRFPSYNRLAMGLGMLPRLGKQHLSRYLVARSEIRGRGSSLS